MAWLCFLSKRDGAMAAARAAGRAIGEVLLRMALRADARIADTGRIDAYGRKLHAQRIEHADMARRANAAWAEQLGEALLHLGPHFETTIVDVRADVDIVTGCKFALLIRGFSTIFTC